MRSICRGAWHLASILPLVVLLFIGGCNSASETQSQNGDPVAKAKEVIAKYIQAVGGRENYLKNKSIHASGSFSMSTGGIKGVVDLYQKQPDIGLLKVKIQGLGEMQQGYDGKVGWLIDPRSGASLAKDRMLDQLRESTDFKLSIYDDSCFKLVKYEGIDTFAGKKCYKLKLITKSGTEMTDYFETDTAYLLGRKSRQASPQGEIDAESITTDYKAFGDIKLPTKLVQKGLGQEQTITFDTIEFGKVDDAVFTPPPSVKALMKGDGNK
jgi:hypothetical protein